MLGIRYIRERTGMTMQELADRLEISKPMISMWESEKKVIPQKRLEQLESVFGIPQSYFSTPLEYIDMSALTSFIKEFLKVEEEKRIEKIIDECKDIKFILYDAEATKLFHELYVKLEMINTSRENPYGIEMVQVSFNVFIAKDTYLDGYIRNFEYTGIIQNALHFQICDYDQHDLELYLEPENITDISFEEEFDNSLDGDEVELKDVYSICFGTNIIKISLDKPIDDYVFLK
jgi:transcriptional regulator with XRE-family HTH domain